MVHAPLHSACPGIDAVCRYILSILRCRNSGNGDNFREEYFRPPVEIFHSEESGRNWVI